MKKKAVLIYALALALTLLSCRKFLEGKTDQSLATIGTLDDLQELLDNVDLMNGQSPIGGDASCDDYYLTDQRYDALSLTDRNIYVWDTAIYNGFPNDWSMVYDPVYVANTVLEELGKDNLQPTRTTGADDIRGQALFYRCKSFFEALSLWAKPFDPQTAATDLGIVMRLNPDFNTPSTRATVFNGYMQVLNDFREASRLLANNQPNPTRPSKKAAYGYLARVYLSMGEFDSCLSYCNRSLSLLDTLQDYNNYSPTTTYPFGRFSPEVLFHSTMAWNYAAVNFNNAIVDSFLYNSYDSNDLRKTLFFKASTAGPYFRGSYARSLYFNGIAIDEVYLMKAECLARLDISGQALAVLNKLLAKRWVKGTYQPIQTLDKTLLVEKILSERRKELLFRGLRWMDLKRLNRLGEGSTLKRKIHNSVYTLMPNSLHFQLPIPNYVVSLGKIPQNNY